MLLGGIGLGVLLALVCRRAGLADRAQARAQRPTSGCATRISEVSEELVVQPIQAELAAYSTMRDGLAIALK